MRFALTGGTLRIRPRYPDTKTPPSCTDAGVDADFRGEKELLVHG